MKNNFLAFIICIAAIVPASSFAINWMKIHQNGQGDTISIDPESIKRNGSLVHYLELIVFDTPRPIKNGLHLKTMETKYVVNCAQRKNAPLDYHGLTTEGQTATLAPIDLANPKFVEVPGNPDSPDAITFNYLCLELK